MGHRSKVFNTGEYRRQMVGANLSHDFWDPTNEDFYQKRSDIARKCLDDALDALANDECDCAIYDSTNATVEVGGAIVVKGNKHSTNVCFCVCSAVISCVKKRANDPNARFSSLR